jgi:outer membrane protein assembly factor BamB
VITGTTELTPARRSVARWVPWVVTPVVALLVSVSLDAVDLVAPDPLGGSSVRFVPPEGHRSVAVAADGIETVTEHSRSIGIEGAFAAPLSVTGALLQRLGDETLREAQWWRASRVSSVGERFVDLYRLSAEGVSQVASWGGPVGFVFEPELLVLPAEVRPGDTWSASGSALAGGALTYRADSIAREAAGPFTDVEGREIPLTGGCIGVETTLRIESPADDFSTELVEAIVWCPGRGQVWSSGTLDGQPVGQAEVRPGALPAAAAPDGRSATWSEAVGPASTLGPGRALELVIDDPFFGASEASGQFWVAPVATPDGRLVTVNDRGDDVQVWTLDGERATLDWAGHPGGTVVSVGAVGDLVLATTARRQVVAYDSEGRRLWSSAADELVLIAPQAAADARHAIVVARSGTVSMLSTATGEAVWTTSIGADARAATTLADGTLLVADERERLTALDAASGEQLWRRDAGLIEVMAADAGTGLVVIMTESGELIARDLDDGEERFSTVFVGVASGIAFGTGVVLALSDEQAIALDGGDGSALWRSAGGVALLGDGEVVGVVQRGSIVLQSTADGGIIDERPFALGSSSSGSAALALGGLIVLVESDGAVQSWALR